MIKSKKNNILQIIIVIFLALIVLFLGYKLLNYYRYTFDKPKDVEEIIKGLKNQNNITIQKKKISEDEYIKIEHIKMKNILDGYIKDENSSIKVSSYKKEINGKNYIINFGGKNEEKQIINAFVEDMTIFSSENRGFLKGNIVDADRKDFLDKNNIKNDVDYYKFVANNYFIESNILSTTKTLKQNYAFNLFTSIVMPKMDSWTIIDGDLTGYIINIGTKDDLTMYQIAIIENGKRYTILTNDSRFKDKSFAIDVVSTIEIVP